jgi:hypothetical protein
MDTNETGHVVAMQSGGNAPQIIRDLSVREALEVITRADESVGERLRAAEKRIDLVQEEVVASPDTTVEYYLLQYSRSRTDDLLSLDLEQTDTELHRNRVDDYHRIGGLGSVLLYRDPDFRGGSKFFSVTWPNFKWSPYRFNDAASSGKAWGGNILFQHTWYGGRRLYMVGLPYFEIRNFKEVDFNDMASSFVSLP